MAETTKMYNHVETEMSISRNFTFCVGNFSCFLLLFLSVCIQHNGHLNCMCRTEGCALAYSDSSGLDVGL